MPELRSRLKPAVANRAVRLLFVASVGASILAGCFTSAEPEYGSRRVSPNTPPADSETKEPRGAADSNSVHDPETGSSSVQRWAIISDSEIRETGLGDLLFVELSSAPDLQLVERELVDKAIGELELSALTGPGETQARLQLGATLKADILLVLSSERGAKNQHVKLVICETRYGARLHMALLPNANGQLAELSVQAAKHALTTRIKYAQGLKYIFGVSPLLCKNVSPKYYHWQTGLSSLLSDSLMQHPGTAVLEIEEARSIGRELQMNGDGSVQDRPVPLFVDGEYLVRYDGTDSNFDEITIRVRRADGQLQEIVRKDISLKDVRAMLRSELPSQWLSNSGEFPDISEAQQSEQLRARADSFSLFGMSGQAVALREAELLLDPDSETRIALTADYSRVKYVGRLFIPGHFTEESWAELIRDQERQLNVHAIAAGHLEYLIRNRRLSCLQATRYFATLDARGGQWMFNSEDRGWRKRVRDVEAEVFWRLYPEIRKLESNAVSVDAWVWGGVDFLRRDVRMRMGDIYQSMNREVADDIYRFLAEVVPPDDFSVNVMHWALGRHQYYFRGQAASGARVPLFERLRDSDRRVNQFYGRCGLLGAKLVTTDTAWRDLDLREAQALATEYAALRGAGGRALEDHHLRDILREIESKLKPTIAPTERVVTAPTYDPAPRVTFRHLLGVKPDWLEIKAYPPNLDLCWSERTVSLIRGPANIEEVYSDFETPSLVTDASWDGKYVWVGTLRSGVHIVEPGRGTIATIDSRHGLPEYNPSFDISYSGWWSSRALVVHPLSHGRCVVSGTSGGQRASRRWFAMLTFEDKVPQASVFHSATHLQMTVGGDRDPHLVFKPAWYAFDAARQRMFVGRLSREDPRLPLVVELSTLEVQVGPTAMPSANWDHAIATETKLFIANPYRVDRYSLEQPDSLPGGQIYKVWRHPNSPYSAVHAADSNAIYMPGKYWFRFDCEEEQMEFLGELPLRHQYEMYGYSTHYGLVAWNRFERLYRASVDDPNAAATFTTERLAEEYPFVPASQRETHHRAIANIRLKGGDVVCVLDRNSTHIRYRGDIKFEIPDSKWRYVAYLPRKCENSSEREKLVAGVHNLQSVSFFDLPAEGLAKPAESGPYNWLRRVNEGSK